MTLAEQYAERGRRREFWVDDGAHRLTALIEGDPQRPPLVLLHGLLSHAGVFWQTIEAFKTTYYCIAIDLLGFGYSDKPRQCDYSIAAQAGRVLHVLDQLDAAQFTLIGHSLGSMIALYLAATSERVQRLVTVSALVVGGAISPYARYVIKPLVDVGGSLPLGWDFTRWALPRLPLYRRLYDLALFEPHTIPPRYTVDHQMALLPGIEQSLSPVVRTSIRSDLSPLLGRIHVPTLAIYGESDNMVRRANSERIAAEVAGARLVCLPCCGHVPMIEQPEAYLDAVRGFL